MKGCYHAPNLMSSCQKYTTVYFSGRVVSFFDYTTKPERTGAPQQFLLVLAGTNKMALIFWPKSLGHF